MKSNIVEKTMGKCKNCIWWRLGFRGNYKGFCKRQAPVIQKPISCDDYTSGWPTTDMNDWCGEFEDKEDI